MVDELTTLGRMAQNLLTLDAVTRTHAARRDPVDVQHLLQRAGRRWSVTADRRWYVTASADTTVAGDGRRRRDRPRGACGGGRRRYRGLGLRIRHPAAGRRACVRPIPPAGGLAGGGQRARSQHRPGDRRVSRRTRLRGAIGQRGRNPQDDAAPARPRPIGRLAGRRATPPPAPPRGPRRPRRPERAWWPRQGWPPGRRRTGRRARWPDQGHIHGQGHGTPSPRRGTRTP